MLQSSVLKFMLHEAVLLDIKFSYFKSMLSNDIPVIANSFEKGLCTHALSVQQERVCMVRRESAQRSQGLMERHRRLSTESGILSDLSSQLQSCPELTTFTSSQA